MVLLGAGTDSGCVGCAGVIGWEAVLLFLDGADEWDPAISCMLGAVSFPHILADVDRCDATRCWLMRDVVEERPNWGYEVL